MTKQSLLDGWKIQSAIDAIEKELEQLKIFLEQEPHPIDGIRLYIGSYNFLKQYLPQSEILNGTIPIYRQNLLNDLTKQRELLEELQ